MVVRRVRPPVFPGNLPGWLVEGVLLGLLASVAVLGVYLAGMRLLDLGQPEGPAHDPDSLRRTEVRAYLAAIGEPATERARIEGVEVAFWLPARAVAITFDAGAFFQLRDAGVTAVLLEHEIPGQFIGARLPFETPAIGRERPEARSSSWAHDILGLAVDADAAAVERAYRERIMEVHPDVGGSSDELIEVIEAYEVLVDGA